MLLRLGREIAAAAAKIGDTVVATSRDPSRLEDLKQMGNVISQALDVRPSVKEVQAKVADIFGRSH